MTQDAGIPPEFRTYALEEVAKILAESGRGLTVRTLQDYCKKGLIRGVKIGTQWRISHANLSLFLNGPGLQPAIEIEEKSSTNSQAEKSLLPRPQQNPISKARRALDQLKLKLEAERARRQDAILAVSESKPLHARIAPGEQAQLRTEEAAAEANEEPTETVDFSDLAGDVSASRGLSEPGRVFDAELGLDQLNRPKRSPEPAFGPGPDELIQGLRESAVLEQSPEPANTVEEEEFPGRDLRMVCELASDDEGKSFRHGVYESWYSGGSQAARGDYVWGQLTGAWQQWHENGQVQVVGAHVEGLPDGPWTWWDEGGRKTQEISYKRGRFDGLWSQFHPNGRKWCEGRYRDGLPEGNFRYWDHEGRPA